MKPTTACSVFGFFLLAGMAWAVAPKVESPVKVANAGLMLTEPYRFNGIVVGDVDQGSGVVAWNSKTLFTAAHLIYDAEGASWGSPPAWFPVSYADSPDISTLVLTRGYFRYRTYTDILTANATSKAQYGKDAVVAYAFQNLISGTPATLNTSGYKDLPKSPVVLITGYPSHDDNTDTDISGSYLYQTGPAPASYSVYSGRSFISDFIATGPGNSGGPVWTPAGASGWTASGIVVAGNPNDNIVHAFSPDTALLTKAVAPAVKAPLALPVAVTGVTGSSYFYPMVKAARAIPDGVKRWTIFQSMVSRFPKDVAVTKVHISLNITTNHVGDLLVILQGPGGVYVTLHNLEGGATHNLVIDDMDVTSSFSGVIANGPWSLRVQDTLKGDVATVNSAVLEISTDGAASTGL